MSDRRRVSDYDRDPYAQQDPYARQGRETGQSRSPYGQQDEYVPSPSSPYAAQGRTDRYGTSDSRTARPSRASDPYRSQRQDPSDQGDRQQPTTAYPIGQGRAYSSTRRTNNASGVRPVEPSGYRAGTYRAGNLTPQNNTRTMSRSTFLKAAGGGIAALALLSFVGVAWYTHRAVACTVNGTVREAPINSTVQDIIDRGYASPSYGNLVSICEEGTSPSVLEKGAGNPYMLTVNGSPVDLESYRLAEGDVLEFINGTDLTEEVVTETTEIPCGIQIPDSIYLLATIGYVKQWGRNGVSTVETGVRSGNRIDRGVTQEPQDLIITNSGINPDDGRMLVALTFDDGPSLTYTPQYLDILAQYGVKATFFNLGLNIEEGDEYRALAQRVVNEGHQLASHTYTHDDATLSGMDAATREWEISDTFDVIQNTTGVATNVFRPPYGEFRGWQFLQYMKETGRDIAYSAYWSVDSLDWELPGADAIVNSCTTGLSGNNYNGAVILMHDGGGDRSQDVQALPYIIETFLNAGYQLVTMNELISSDSTIPEWVGSGNAARPDWAVIPDTSAYF